MSQENNIEITGINDSDPETNRCPHYHSEKVHSCIGQCKLDEWHIGDHECDFCYRKWNPYDP